MKPRSALSAAEIAELYEFLDRKLERIGVPSRPEVALRLLDLAGDATSEMRDYASVIRMDHAMSGRVLKLANSAFFAQRTPITNLDRACLVLGLERIKAVTLGLQLSRALSASASRDISREVWGQSVFRACLAAEAARTTAPALVPEAFIVGLMLDSGVPLMSRLVGDSYEGIYADARTPGALFRRENEALGFNHVDVVTAMARRWRFPDVLLRPIEWHHTRPADLRRPEPVHRLHKIAYVVGLLELEPDSLASIPEVKGQEAGATTQRLLGLKEEEVGQVFARTLSEYSATIDLFSEVAASLTDLESLVERINVGLVEVIDNGVEQSLSREEVDGGSRLVISGQSVEVRRSEDGAVVGYLYDGQGQRLLTHRFTPGELTADALAFAFGLDLSDATERERLTQFMLRQAA